MKKKIILCFASFTLIMTNCKKDEKNMPKVQSPANTSMQASREISNLRMRNFINYPDDAEMTNVNLKMFVYLESMKALLANDVNLFNRIYNKTKTDYQNGLFLESFINGSGRCRTLFNRVVSKLFPTLDPQELPNNMIIEGLNYQPTLVLYNAEYSENNGDYYLALMVEDPESYREDEGYEYIPAYHVLANGDSKLVMIDAYDSYYQSTPVFVFNYELLNDTETRGGKFIAKTANPSDPETFHPLGLYFDPEIKYAPPIRVNPGLTPGGGTGSNPGGGTGGTPSTGENKLYHESVNLFAHHEQYGGSEYSIVYSYKLSSSAATNAANWNRDILLGNVPRNYVNCGCYYPLNYEFVAMQNNYYLHFLTFEYDRWAGYKNFEVTTPSGVSFGYDYRASKSTDKYVWDAEILVNSIYPNINSYIDYTNGPALYKIRRH